MNILENLENLIYVLERFSDYTYIQKKQDAVDRALEKVPLVNGQPDQESEEWNDYMSAKNALSDAEGLVKHVQDKKIEQRKAQQQDTQKQQAIESAKIKRQLTSENPEISEACFEDIMGIVEELLYEGQKQLRRPYKKALPGLIKRAVNLTSDNPDSDAAWDAQHQALNAYEKSHPGRFGNDELVSNIHDLARLKKRENNILQAHAKGNIQTKEGKNGKKAIIVKKENGHTPIESPRTTSSFVTRPVKHLYSDVVNPKFPSQSDVEGKVKKEPKSDYKSFEKGIKDKKQEELDKEFIYNKNQAIDAKTPEEAEEYTKKANAALKSLGSKTAFKNPKK